VQKFKTFNLIFTLIIAVILIQSCGKADSESKSMDQIYTDQGVPVKTTAIKLSTFDTGKTFHQTLTGIQQSTASAAVADKVEKINFSAGDKVKQNQVVMTFPVDNPAAQYFQAKSAFEHIKATLLRMQNLYDNGGISLQELENTKTQYKVIKANWAAARKSVKTTAPISGIITEINVCESDNVKPGDKLFTVSCTDRLKTKLWVSENHILEIAKGDEATASWNGRTIFGSVAQVNLSMNGKKQAFGVTVEFDNHESKIPGGVNAEINISLKSSLPSVIIERKNLLKYKNAYTVFVAENGKACQRTVQIGRQQDLDVEILTGLKAGDLLITESKHLLADGAKISIRN